MHSSCAQKLAQYEKTNNVAVYYKTPPDQTGHQSSWRHGQLVTKDLSFPNAYSKYSNQTD